MRKVLLNLKNLISLTSESSFDLENNCATLKITTQQLISLIKRFLHDKQNINVSKIENITSELAREIRLILMQVQKNKLQNEPTLMRNSSDDERFREKIPFKKQRSESISGDRMIMTKTSPKTPITQNLQKQVLQKKSSSDSISSINMNTVSNLKELQITSNAKGKNEKVQKMLEQFLSNFKESSNEWNLLPQNTKNKLIQEIATMVEKKILSMNLNRSSRVKSMRECETLRIGSQEEDKQAKKTLKSLFNADSLDDWQKMLTGNKDLYMEGIGTNQKVTITTDDNQSGNSLQELFNDMGKSTLELIVHANQAVLSDKTTEQFLSEKVKKLYDTSIKILSLLSTNLESSFKTQIDSILESLITNLGKAEVSSSPNQYIVLDAKGQLKQLVYSGLLKQLFTSSNSLRVISLHALTTMKRMLENSPPFSENVVLQIAASIKTLTLTVSTLLNVVSTAKAISSLQDSLSESTKIEYEEQEDDIEFWDEYFQISSLQSFPGIKVHDEYSAFPGIKIHFSKSSKKPLPKKGTLNKLIEAITSFENLGKIHSFYQKKMFGTLDV